jgi:hypothetical protein
MAAPKIRKGKLTPADLASFGILPKLSKGAKVAKGPKPKTLDRAAVASEPDLVF